MRARWRPAPEVADSEVRGLVRALRLPPAMCRVLAVRGLADADRAKRFLRPRLEHLADPGLMADMDRAAERVWSAIRRDEVVLVHGDYDVDGICGTALLTRWLRRMGGRVAPFVPHRVRDGYDLSEAGLAAARDAGAGLILTVDCGTLAHDAVARAGREGLDVVVTDHHTVGATLPPAHAVVNPRRADCAYPDKGLCGAGVAYRLAERVAQVGGMDPEPVREELDLVALATVADLVPLVGENRVLVSHGLRTLGRTRNPGLAALMAASGTDPSTLTAGKLGFGLAPRINAAGRMGEARDALALLLGDDPREAGVLADRLERLNRERQEEDRRTEAEAVRDLEGSFDPDRDFGVVLASTDWHPGVIGIVASRIVERIHRPVVLVALHGDRGRGSARSIPGFHLYEALSTCAPLLERFGGHRQAAGLEVTRASLPEFKAAFNEAARRRLEGTELRPELRPDMDLEWSEADLDLVHWLSYLGPHGIGNPAPLFRTAGLSLEGAREVGRGHLKAVLRRDDITLDAIGFGAVERFPPETLTGPHDVLYRLDRNEWRGKVTPQARLVDLRPGGAAE